MNWLSRIRLPSVVVVGLLVSLAGNTALANPDFRDNLVGLWEGVDTLDGSTIRVSIGDMERDRRLEFRWHESFFTGCFDANLPEGRGVIAGTVDRLNSDEIEFVVTSYVCFDSDNNAVELDTFSVDLEYSPNEDILTRTSADGFPGFILYRVSSGGGR